MVSANSVSVKAKNVASVPCTWTSVPLTPLSYLPQFTLISYHEKVEFLTLPPEFCESFVCPRKITALCSSSSPSTWWIKKLNKNHKLTSCDLDVCATNPPPWICTRSPLDIGLGGWSGTFFSDGLFVPGVAGSFSHACSEWQYSILIQLWLFCLGKKPQQIQKPFQYPKDISKNV